MVMELTNGMMDENIKVNTSMIENTVMEYTHGPMVENMMVVGPMVFVTAEPNIFLKMEVIDKEFGLTIKE